MLCIESHKTIYYTTAIRYIKSQNIFPVNSSYLNKNCFSLKTKDEKIPNLLCQPFFHSLKLIVAKWVICNRIRKTTCRSLRNLIKIKKK